MKSIKKSRPHSNKTLLYHLQKPFIWLLISLMPKRFISYVVGLISYIALPSWLFKLVTRIYIKKYAINVDEMVLPLSSYNTLSTFFTRAIRWQDRYVVDFSEQVIVSPVDATVLDVGQVSDESIFRIKGFNYYLHHLISSPEYISIFKDANWVALYLGPGDYHRVHMPIKGRLTKIEYHSGNLFPVNHLGVHYIRNLFCINERLVSYFQTQFGMMAMVKVAALNVGKIKTDYLALDSRRYFSYLKRKPIIKEMTDKHYIYDKLDEVAQFQLGSSVILFFEKPICQFETLLKWKKLYVGQPLAKVICDVKKR